MSSILACDPDVPWLASESPYTGYAYGYPHKTAYRRLEPARALADVWAAQPGRDSLFLYLHVPFCEMRCGFCNLFTMARPGGDLSERFVRTLRHQAEVTRAALGDEARFVRLAIGGGTPTQLPLEALAEVFAIATQVMGADAAQIPVACEVSPETLDADKVALLREQHVDRVSIGVQSFDEAETRALRRPQSREVARAAIARLRQAGFATVNIDLIYGIPGQTAATWRRSLDEALEFAPQELFLYPLYVRPGTGLGRSRRLGAASDDPRLARYREGRDLLLERGYVQHSMRMFRHRDAPPLPEGAPSYRCQQDGMVGLGVGARSYTDTLHYSTEWAVMRPGVVALIEEWVARPPERFAWVDHGFALDDAEQRLRDVILSILNAEGLDRRRYRARFGSCPLDDVPSLYALLEHGLLAEGPPDVLRPTSLGLERSDAIGPWLYSAVVRERMAAWEESR